MRRLNSAAIGVLALSLGSCSGEELKIHACLAGKTLAFELDDVHGLFRVPVRPRPSTIEVMNVGNAGADLWYVQPNLDRTAARRSIIAYGEKLNGTTVEKTAQPLQPGHVYRVFVSGGANMGAATLRLSPHLPPCTKELGR